MGKRLLLSEELPGDDADLCKIAECHEEVLTVFSGEAECADVGDADSSYCIASSCEMCRLELPSIRRADSVLQQIQCATIALWACTEQSV